MWWCLLLICFKYFVFNQILWNFLLDKPSSVKWWKPAGYHCPYYWHRLEEYVATNPNRRNIGAKTFKRIMRRGKLKLAQIPPRRQTAERVLLTSTHKDSVPRRKIGKKRESKKGNEKEKHFPFSLFNSYRDPNSEVRRTQKAVFCFQNSSAGWESRGKLREHAKAISRVRGKISVLRLSSSLRRPMRLYQAGKSFGTSFCFVRICRSCCVISAAAKWYVCLENSAMNLKQALSLLAGYH